MTIELTLDVSIVTFLITFSLTKLSNSNLKNEFYVMCQLLKWLPY